MLLAVSIAKMFKNKWFFLCLLIACVFSVAIIATMPAFENAIKQRMIHREFMELQQERFMPPLVHFYSAGGATIAGHGDGTVMSYEAYLEQNIFSNLILPIQARHLSLTSQVASVYHISPDWEYAEQANRNSIMYTRGLFDHVELVAGRFPVETGEEGRIEVVISEAAATRITGAGGWLPLMIDSDYLQTRPAGPQAIWFYFRIVGIVREINPADPFWVVPLDNSNVYTTFESFVRIFQEEDPVNLFSARWDTVLDFNAIQPADVEPLLDFIAEPDTGSLTHHQVLRRAADLDVAIGTFLWVLLVPNLALLVFFTIMMSGLILDNDKIEISLFYSRGAGKLHIFAMYAIQTFIIAATAIALGIPLGMNMVSALGASAGFLEFTGRAPLIATVTSEVVLYAFAGAGLFALSMLLPILLSRPDSVVTKRRAKAARGGKPFFERIYLDVILIAMSAYGYFTYHNFTELVTEAEVEIAEHAIDPLIFLISTFFLLGFAMLFTRLYPYIIRLLFKLGRPIWPPAIYASLSAARARPRSRYIMLFVIVAVSIGLYSAAAARTINQNHIDRVMFDVGADMVIVERWPFIDPNPRWIHLHYVIPEFWEAFFSAPPFELFNQPEGVALATPVYRNNRARVNPPGLAGVNNVNVIAIYPDEFAQVSWWREDMYHYHLNYKMNAMSLNPNTVLVCSNLMYRLRLEHGDELTVGWIRNPSNLQVFVYDAVDFFPTFNPVGPDGRTQYLIVMNYSLIEAYFRIEPYAVWVLLEEGASSAEVMHYIQENRVNMPLITHNVDPNQLPFAFTDAGAMIENIQNDPFILSMNGFLTLSFVMTLAVMAVGFLVFWIFDLRSRRLQISIMRSKGMSQGSVITMLLWEQALLSLLPLAAGFALGEISARLFVPMFEMGAAESVLPFKIFREASDTLQVGATVFAIILLAIAVLWFMAQRIKISQTLKLGEE